MKKSLKVFCLLLAIIFTFSAFAVSSPAAVAATPYPITNLTIEGVVFDENNIDYRYISNYSDWAEGYYTTANYRNAILFVPSDAMYVGFIYHVQGQSGNTYHYINGTYKSPIYSSVIQYQTGAGSQVTGTYELAVYRVADIISSSYTEYHVKVYGSGSTTNFDLYYAVVWE